MMQLRELKRKIDATLEGRNSLDPYSLAHLARSTTANRQGHRCDLRLQYARESRFGYVAIPATRQEGAATPAAPVVTPSPELP